MPNSKFLKYNKLKSQTLIEVVISIALAVMVISALLVLGAASSKTVASSLKRAQATKLATDKIEEARYIRDNYGYDAVDLDTDIDPSNDLYLDSTKNISLNNNQFTLTTQITDVTDPKHKQVIVTVSWEESSGGNIETKSVTIPTILSDWK